jgi:soluble lytic murein transglycosylase-like protein
MVLLPIVFLVALWPIAASAADYTVRKGDTLWAISRRYNTTVKAIAAANKITNPSLIRIGQRLYIPTGSSNTASKPLATPPPANWLEVSTVKPIPSTHYDAIHQWDQMTNYYASYYKVDPDLIRRVMYVESRGSQYAKSSSGALGLMQVMPFWFKAGEDPYNAWTNVGRGVYILRWSYDRWGTWEKACAGYLGGITSTGTITSSGAYYVSLIFYK